MKKRRDSIAISRKGAKARERKALLEQRKALLEHLGIKNKRCQFCGTLNLGNVDDGTPTTCTTCGADL